MEDVYERLWLDAKLESSAESLPEQVALLKLLEQTTATQFKWVGTRVGTSGSCIMQMVAYNSQCYCAEHTRRSNHSVQR